jgi:hypothetical protein
MDGWELAAAAAGILSDFRNFGSIIRDAPRWAFRAAGRLVLLPVDPLTGLSAFSTKLWRVEVLFIRSPPASLVFAVLGNEVDDTLTTSCSCMLDLGSVWWVALRMMQETGGNSASGSPISWESADRTCHRFRLFRHGHAQNGPNFKRSLVSILKKHLTSPLIVRTDEFNYSFDR